MPSTSLPTLPPAGRSSRRSDLVREHLYVAGYDAVAVFARDSADGSLSWLEVVRNGVGDVRGLEAQSRFLRLLELTAFVPNADQSVGVAVVMKGPFGVLPGICALIGAALVVGFSLDARETERIRTALDARRAVGRSRPRTSTPQTA